MASAYQPLGGHGQPNSTAIHIQAPSALPGAASGRRTPHAIKLALALVLVAAVILTTRELHYAHDVAGRIQSSLAASGWRMPSSTAPHTTAKCVLIQEGGLNSGGYGDQVRLTHRAEFMAQVLGCDFLRTYVESGHGYASSNLFARASSKLSLAAHRTCDVRQVLDVASIEADNHDCAPKITGDTSECDIYTYAPRGLFYNSNKLACVANRLREKMVVPITKSRPGCESGYGALHYRYGDLASAAGNDFRTTSTIELDDAIDMMKSRYGFSDECVVVFAEKYPHRRIAGTKQGHVIDNGTDPIQAMSDMAGATVLFGAASGFMLPIVLMFDGKQIIVPPGVKHRFEGLPRNTVELTESRVEMTRIWPVHPEDQPQSQ
ncbi:hypothetical protein OIV83_004255 [Microbotryomycetes sp. JL201]|nr:hypothetical protein OIV83_004255 [Microbotryomycetes sp. JL201]